METWLLIVACIVGGASGMFLSMYLRKFIKEGYRRKEQARGQQ